MICINHLQEANILITQHAMIHGLKNQTTSEEPKVNEIEANHTEEGIPLLPKP